jgi:hypothetical protein
MNGGLILQIIPSVRFSQFKKTEINRAVRKFSLDHQDFFD